MKKIIFLMSLLTLLTTSVSAKNNPLKPCYDGGTHEECRLSVVKYVLSDDEDWEQDANLISLCTDYQIEPACEELTKACVKGNNSRACRAIMKYRSC